jgi:hypothetical protein
MFLQGCSACLRYPFSFTTAELLAAILGIKQPVNIDGAFDNICAALRPQNMEFSRQLVGFDSLTRK